MSMTQTQSTQHKQYILRLQSPLYELVKKETDLRLRHLVLVTNHCSNCLQNILCSKAYASSIQPQHYRINRRIYHNYLFMASEAIRAKCEKGINFKRFKKEINEKNIWNALKGYWFHNVPAMVNQHLWVPILKDIADFYRDFCSFWSSAFEKQYFVYHYDSVTMLGYLHKKFLICLLEVKCQINQNSNPSGSLIQSACWKLKSFQEAISALFDDNDSYPFAQWMNQKTENGSKTLNISKIVSECIKPHAKRECGTFLKSMGIHEDYEEFQVDKSTIHLVMMFHENTDDGNESVVSGKTSLTTLDTVAHRAPYKQPDIAHNNTHISDSCYTPTNEQLCTKVTKQRKFRNEFEFSAENMKTRMHRVKCVEQQKNNKAAQRQQSIRRHLQNMKRNSINNDAAINCHYRNNNNHNAFVAGDHWNDLLTEETIYNSNNNNNNINNANCSNNSYNNHCYGAGCATYCPQCCPCCTFVTSQHQMCGDTQCRIPLRQSGYNNYVYNCNSSNIYYNDNIM